VSVGCVHLSICAHLVRREALPQRELGSREREDDLLNGLATTPSLLPHNEDALLRVKVPEPVVGGSEKDRVEEKKGIFNDSVETRVDETERDGVTK
jgi:hypothetical protein